MLSINTNLSGLIAQNSMKTSTDKLNQAIERMTTGFKINHASDNAANYSIVTHMTTRINSFLVAEENCAMGLDMITTASESLEQINDKLIRLRDLAIQASNGTYGEQSLNAINAEANALVDEINRTYSAAEYNGIKFFTAEEMSSGVSTRTFNMARSMITYTQYDDNYVLATIKGDAPESEKITVSFTDGTVLFSKFVGYSVTCNITWADLVVPDTYTWDESQGCYLDSSGNSQALRILKECSDVGGFCYDSELSVYGVENIINIPDPAPDPDPPPGGGTGGSTDGDGVSSPTVPTYSPDSIMLQVGVGSGWSSQIGFSTKFSLTGIEEFRNIGIDTTSNYLNIIDSKLHEVSEKQTELGAVSNRLESVLEEIATQYGNLISSRSTLRDADIAEVSSEYIRQQILQQASASLMATANQSPAIALQLI